MTATYDKKARKLNEAQLKEFVRQCRVAKTLDFPTVANGQGWNWRTEIKPRLDDPKVAWFRGEMEDFLEDMRYKLVHALHSAAIGAAPKGAMIPSAASINSMLKMIDSGILLGAVKEEKPAEEKVDTEAERKWRERLGLSFEPQKEGSEAPAEIVFDEES